MKLIIQRFLLGTYTLIEKTGILNIPLIRSIFTKAYELYKVVIEAGEIQSLQNYIKPGEVVVDIGANVGFFTKRFSNWISDGGFIIAVEPEEINFSQLTKYIDQAGLHSKIKAFKGVASETSGKLTLDINPNHPGDHKIGTQGIEVNSYTVDELINKVNASKVCLMKIDVQGAEERVLNGAKEMIMRDHPAIFIEVDDVALKKMGSSSQKIIDWLLEQNYNITRLEKGKVAKDISVEEALRLSSNGLYTDLLFI